MVFGSGVAEGGGVDEGVEEEVEPGTELVLLQSVSERLVQFFLV